MTREEAISEWTVRRNHIKKWLDENGEEPSLRHYVELTDMAIEALQREEAEAKGYCHRYLDKGLLMFLALSFPAPEEAPDDWFHHEDENLDAWRAYIMKCKERGYYDIPVEY